MTFNEHVNAALELAREAQNEATSRFVPPAGAELRDLALSITHLEDALTRYNSSRYRRNGTWKRVDPDA